MTAPAGATRALVVGPLGDVYRDDATLDALSTRFAERGYVKLPGLLTDDVLKVLRGGDRRARVCVRERATSSCRGPTRPACSASSVRRSCSPAPRAAILYAHFELVGVIARVASTAVRGVAATGRSSWSATSCCSEVIDPRLAPRRSAARARDRARSARARVRRRARARLRLGERVRELGARGGRRRGRACVAAARGAGPRRAVDHARATRTCCAPTAPAPRHPPPRPRVRAASR